MQNLVLVVQNTAKPTEIGVASSGVTFFRSLGGTIGVSIMGAALASSVTDLMADAQDELMSAIVSLGVQGAEVADQLQSGTLPQVSAMPEVVRVIVEDIYAQGIARSFLIAVPFAIISLVAVVFLPNKPLTRMTTSERIQASEADLATVSVAEGMDVLTATATPTAMGTATATATPTATGRGTAAAPPTTTATTPAHTTDAATDGQTRTDASAEASAQR
jgi:CTP:molybdopterin cytidylyltransferase MocA